MSCRYRAVRDPYSDDDRDWVVWDDKTWSMPFQATQRDCEAIASELNAGRPYDAAERIANP